MKVEAKSDGIIIFFCGWLQLPPGQLQGASLSCLLGLGGGKGFAEDLGGRAGGGEDLGGMAGVAEEVGTEEAEETLRQGLKVKPVIK